MKNPKQPPLPKDWAASAADKLTMRQVAAVAAVASSAQPPELGRIHQLMTPATPCSKREAWAVLQRLCTLGVLAEHRQRSKYAHPKRDTVTYGLTEKGRTAARAWSAMAAQLVAAIDNEGSTTDGKKRAKKPAAQHQRVVAELVIKSDLFAPTDRGPLFADLRFFLTDAADRRRLVAFMLQELQAAMAAANMENDDDGQEESA